MGGPWRPKLGFFALLAMVQGTLGMCNHSNWPVIKCNGHTGFSRIWTLCRQNASGAPPICVSVLAFTVRTLTAVDQADRTPPRNLDAYSTPRDHHRSRRKNQVLTGITHIGGPWDWARGYLFFHTTLDCTMCSVPRGLASYLRLGARVQEKQAEPGTQRFIAACAPRLRVEEVRECG